MMEEVCIRFPLLAKEIMNQVGDKSMVKFREASRVHYECVNQQRFYWLRIIRRNKFLIDGPDPELQNVWKKVLRRTPVDVVKDLAIAVFCFPNAIKTNFGNEDLSRIHFVEIFPKLWHPIFVAKIGGSSEVVLDHIVERTLLELEIDPEEFVEFLYEKLRSIYWMYLLLRGLMNFGNNVAT